MSQTAKQPDPTNTGEMTRELFEAILMPVAQDECYQQLARGAKTALSIEVRNRFGRSAYARAKQVLIAHHGERIIERISRHCEAVNAQANALTNGDD
jgi:hypothetical protein